MRSEKDECSLARPSGRPFLCLGHLELVARQFDAIRKLIWVPDDDAHPDFRAELKKWVAKVRHYVV
jgi:hypothetical protein